MNKIHQLSFTMMICSTPTAGKKAAAMGWVDPFQLSNLVDDPEYTKIKEEMEAELSKLLLKTNDKFLPGDEYMKLWDYD